MHQKDQSLFHIHGTSLMDREDSQVIGSVYSTDLSTPVPGYDVRGGDALRFIVSMTQLVVPLNLNNSQ